MSSTIASSILRKLSACRSSLEAELQRRQLRHALDHVRDLLAEQLAHLLDGVRRVLDDVVQQARGDGDHVEPHVGEDVGHLERMDEVRLTGSANLPFVFVGGEHVGTAQQLRVSVGIGRAHSLDEIFEPDHGLASAR